nr:hypothetical protein [Haloprofundus salilacus]
MGIADRSDAGPATYRRNPPYFRGKWVEQLAHEHTPAELRTRVDELIDEDRGFQERYGVPGPDAVIESETPDTDSESVHERWDELAEWRTVRRDISVLERAVRRAESMRDDRARA